jgi:PmbA protein
MPRKVALALDLERSLDPRVTKVENVRAAMRVAGGWPRRRRAAAYERPARGCVVVRSPSRAPKTQTGFRSASVADLDLGYSREAVERGRGCSGRQAADERCRCSSTFAGSSFLGVLAGALSAEAVQKGRSLFVELVGQRVGSEAFTLVDDGRLLAGPAASPFDDEGVPTARTELITRGTLNGFLHNSYTAHRGGTASTGNAQRAGYRSVPGVGVSNFYVEPGVMDLPELLAEANGGVLIQDVSGVHSGANPISGEFSVGATGLRIQGGALGEPLREMTIASTVPEMLQAVSAVGSDLRFFTSVGVPSVLIGEMTVAGV